MARRWMRPGIVRWLSGLLASVLMVAAVSGLLQLVEPYVPPLHLLVLYVPVVLVVAIVWGTGLAAVSAVPSVGRRLSVAGTRPRWCSRPAGRRGLSGLIGTRTTTPEPERLLRAAGARGRPSARPLAWRAAFGARCRWQARARQSSPSARRSASQILPSSSRLRSPTLTRRPSCRSPGRGSPPAPTRPAAGSNATCTTAP